MRKWIRDLFLLPIIVGIVLLLVQVVLNEFVRDQKGVSISVEGPLDFMTINKLLAGSDTNMSYVFINRQDYDAPATRNPISVDAKATPSDTHKLMPPVIKSIESRLEVDDVRIYQVVLKNSGSVPLIDVPLRLVFAPKSDNFMIISIEHKTSPAYEFGPIESNFSNHSQPRFMYPLLNPGDEDSITMLVNQPATLNAFVKAEGISKSTVQQIDDDPRLSLYALAGVGAASVFLVLLLQAIILKCCAKIFKFS